jgi:hypothetical protein
MFGLKIVKEKDYNKLIEQSKKMSQALIRIRTWFGEFPRSQRYFENGNEMSYGEAFGSNGERDYMRRVADNVLLD